MATRPIAARTERLSKQSADHQNPVYPPLRTGAIELPLGYHLDLNPRRTNNRDH